MNGYFTLNSILLRYVYSSEACLSQLCYSYYFKLALNVGEL